MTYNQRIGKWGEQVAAEYLVSRRCGLIGRNVRFIEVKTRTSNKMGLPEESISVRKRDP